MANPNPQPPKRKKASSASRKPKGNKNKRTKYDYDAARNALSLPSNATSQAIVSRATPAGHSSTSGVDRSPLKKEYKAMLFVDEDVDDFESDSDSEDE